MNTSHPARDSNGFLRDWRTWTPDVAEQIASEEGIQLSKPHWEIVSLLRSFYERYDGSPANRALVNFVKRELGPEKGNSIYLMSLFPGSPARIASRIAGLPKPKNCL